MKIGTHTYPKYTIKVSRLGHDWTIEHSTRGRDYMGRDVTTSFTYHNMTYDTALTTFNRITYVDPAFSFEGISDEKS